MTNTDPTTNITAVKSAAIVEQLRAWAPLVAVGYEVPAAGQSMFESANTIEELLAALKGTMDILGRAESNASGMGAEWDYVGPRVAACRAALAKAGAA